jgi:hypothetical protein
VLDPRTDAVRRDLADVRLAETVFAPHYAEPVRRVVLRDTTLHASPAPDAAAVSELKAGDAFDLLDTTGGFCWGVATRHGLVGYVEADAIGPEAEAAA